MPLKQQYTLKRVNGITYIHGLTFKRDHFSLGWQNYIKSQRNLFTTFSLNLYKIYLCTRTTRELSYKVSLVQMPYPTEKCHKFVKNHYIPLKFSLST